MAIRELTGAEMRQLLTCISADCCRADWIGHGFEIHDWNSGPDGEALFRTWSATSGKFKDGEPEREWRSFRAGGGRGLGSLIEEAKANGWADPRPSNGSSGLSLPPFPRGATVAVPEPRTIEPPAPPAAAAKKAKHYLWGNDSAEAARRFHALPMATATPAAVEFLKREYHVPIAPSDWRYFDHPEFGPGIVVRGDSPNRETSFKFKSFARNEKNKRESRFLHDADEKSMPTALYFSFHTVAVSEDKPLVIVEGEEKAWAAHLEGYNALTTLNGTALGPEWCEWIAKEKFPAVILAYDADRAGHVATNGSMRKDGTRRDGALDALRAAGVPRAAMRVVEWPEGSKPGYDVTDALGDGILKGLLARAPAPFPGVTVWTLSQFQAHQPPENDNLLEDMVITRGNGAAIYGPAGIGKTRICLNLGFNGALGWEWAGLKTDMLGMRHLFIQAENGARRTKYDLSRMVYRLSSSDRDVIEQSIFITANRTNEDLMLRLDNRDTIARLSDTVAAIDPHVIWWDPLASFWFGKHGENDAGDMGAVVSVIRSISQCVSLDVAYNIVQHSPGGRLRAGAAVGYDRGNYGRGSTALYGSVRGAINIAPGSEDETPPLVIAWGKSNDGKPWKPRAVRLEEYNWQYRVDESFDHEAWRGEVSGKKGRGRKSTTPELDISLVRMILEGTTEGCPMPLSTVIDQALETAGNVGKTKIRDTVLWWGENDSRVTVKKEMSGGPHGKFFVWWSG